MDTAQRDAQREGNVIKDYQAEFTDPIAVAAGETVSVGEQTSIWEGNPAWLWLWCTDLRGKSGWTPQNRIQLGAHQPRLDTTVI